MQDPPEQEDKISPSSSMELKFELNTRLTVSCVVAVALAYGLLTVSIARLTSRRIVEEVSTAVLSTIHHHFKSPTPETLWHVRLDLSAFGDSIKHNLH